ncbi:FecR family protein [Mangrovibacterium marinum]|uniref:FecR family protein n=1 Tax=Mangrovibacterium marinum TaxID=1639118 RepID=A0A2T5C2L3_9BACT|nr:FecR domain-containing protein [Mangrovibacterium marinum]PTN08961.1 FecR family protein [Mangrovibacterium marinum]
MGTPKDNTNEKWAALAKQLFDEPAPDKAQPGEDAWDEQELQQICETARQVDLHLHQRRFAATRDYPAVEAIIRKQNRPVLWRLNRFWMRIAALVALVLLLGSVLLWTAQSNWQTVAPESAVTDNYGRTRIELADGSVVTLNRGSRLDYPDQFKGDIREVSLNGEAFFEVRPNAAKAFVIHAGPANIRVVGTSFNVNARPTSGEVAVVVESGKVEVSAANRTDKAGALMLSPGQRGLLVGSASVFEKSTNIDPNYLAWKTHSFQFEKTSLEEVIKQLNKVYNVHIVTADPAMDQLLLTAHFDDRPIRFILEVIAMTHKLTIQQTDAEAYLLSKK